MKIEKEVCLAILKKKYPGQEHALVDWKLEGFDQLIGFHGNHMTLNITVKIKDKDTRLRFFVKSAFEEKSIFEYFKKIRCFEKEYYMYKNVLEVLESQIGEKITPKCYSNELNKFIVMEDLAEQGYTSCGDKFSEWSHLEPTVRKLATFHAGSFIIQEKSGMKLAQKFPMVAFETFVTDMEGSTFLATSNIVKHIVNKRMDGIPENIKPDFYDWSVKILFDRTKPSEKYKNIMGHGDVWYMNYMYKYNKAGEVQDVLLVDFQASRICAPAYELQLLLGLRYPYDLMISKGQSVLNVYYDQLAKVLKKAELDVRDILPRKELEESFELYRVAGVGAKALYTVITFLPPVYLQKANTPAKLLKLLSEGDPELCIEAFDNDETYKNLCTSSIMANYKEYCNYNKTH